MIAKLERALITVFKTRTKHKIPQVVGSIMNNKSTTTEPLPSNGQQSRHPYLEKTIYIKMAKHAKSQDFS